MKNNAPSKQQGWSSANIVFHMFTTGLNWRRVYHDPHHTDLIVGEGRKKEKKTVKWTFFLWAERHDPVFSCRKNHYTPLVPTGEQWQLGHLWKCQMRVYSCRRRLLTVDVEEIYRGPKGNLKINRCALVWKLPEEIKIIRTRVRRAHKMIRVRAGQCEKPRRSSPL